jgi:hypothetical protein
VFRNFLHDSDIISVAVRDKSLQPRRFFHQQKQPRESKVYPTVHSKVPFRYAATPRARRSPSSLNLGTVLEVHPPAAEVNTSSTARAVVSLLLSENDSQNRNTTNLPSQQKIATVKVHFAGVHNAGRGC